MASQQNILLYVQFLSFFSFTITAYRYQNTYKTHGKIHTCYSSSLSENGIKYHYLTQQSKE